MDDPVETHRSFVNSWECDENVHLNVQFFWKRFGEAARIFQTISGGAPARWFDRHVRYHGELRMGANTIIHSQKAGNCDLVIHRLSNGDSGQLSATAIDSMRRNAGLPNLTVDDLPEEAAPVSLPTTPLQPIDTAPMIESDRGLITHRGIVQPDECDETGELLDQYHISRFSDAASHLWQHIGASRDWMNANNLGTVAIEMKATRHQSPHAGMLIQVVSWLEQLRDRTLTFRHQASDISTGRPLYCGAVTALLMDLDLRKATKLPDFLGKGVKLSK